MKPTPKSPALDLAAAILIGVTAACGPSLVDQCRSACQHIYRDCLTGNSCSKCATNPEDTVGEAACEADCETRPNLCRDPGAVYACLAKSDCSAPDTPLVSDCYARGECVSLPMDAGPSASLGSLGVVSEEAQIVSEVTVELCWSDAGAHPFCLGGAVDPEVASFMIVGAGGSSLVVPGSYEANTDIPECVGSCKVCPPDAGACTSVVIGQAEQAWQFWTMLPVTGTIELLDVSGTHVAGSFVASQVLPDGGVIELQGSFDAPQDLQTPSVPSCTVLCGCSTGGSQLGAMWIIGLVVLARRRRSCMVAERGR